MALGTIPRPRRGHRRALATFVALAVPLLAAPGAQAGLLPDCGDRTYTQAFSQFGDPSWYTLAPGGAFEASHSGWTADRDTTRENEPWYVNSTADVRSLSLAPGQSAVSPPMCVTVDYATLRMFARRAGSGSSKLRVEAVYPALAGTTQTTLATLSSDGGWAPTAPMPVVANLFALSSGGTTTVSFRLTVVGGSGSWQVDDVFVDPYRRG